MGLTIGKTIDDYTYWIDGPELPRDKKKSRSKSSSSSSYKSVKSHSSLKSPPPLPFKEGENVYGLKSKSNKKKSKSNKKTKKKTKGSKDKLKV